MKFINKYRYKYTYIDLEYYASQIDKHESFRALMYRSYPIVDETSIRVRSFLYKYNHRFDIHINLHTFN